MGIEAHTTLKAAIDRIGMMRGFFASFRVPARWLPGRISG
jgi:hypothetical protein